MPAVIWPVGTEAPHVTLTTKGCWTTVTVVVATAVFPLASLTSKDSWNVPLTGSVTVKVPVPWYGPVPPVALTVQVNGLPAVIAAEEEPQVTLTTNGCWTTVTWVEAIALLPFASWTVNDSVKVPFTGSVTLIEPVPWYGAVPPVADTVHVNGLPAVIAADAEPHVTLTTKGCWTTVTCVEAIALLPLASLTVKDSVNVPFTGWVTLNVPVPWYG